MREFDRVYEYRAMPRVEETEVYLDYDGKIRNEAKHRATCQKNRAKRKKRRKK